MDRSTKKTTNVTANKRILNEINAKVVNEQNSDKVVELRKDTKVSHHAEMLFGCECDTKSCPGTISLSPAEYAHVHQKNMHFMVLPNHVRLDIEEVVTRFKYYCVVKKLFPQPRVLEGL